MDGDKGSGIAQTERKWFAAVLSPFKEREIPGYNYQFATGKAITGSRDNDTPVQSQVERKCPLGIKASQLMRAAPGDPRRGAIPVELVSSQSFGDFPMFIVKVIDESRDVEDK
ncbi:MAG: hypothetical protein K2N63_15375 [Lachnospiraceae bacterium]|nr:hypothetical protein [Lachnospiraceae bacterium]